MSWSKFKKNVASRSIRKTILFLFFRGNDDDSIMFFNFSLEKNDWRNHPWFVFQEGMTVLQQLALRHLRDKELVKEIKKDLRLNN